MIGVEKKLNKEGRVLNLIWLKHASKFESTAKPTDEEPTQEAQTSLLKTLSPNDLTPTDEGQTSGGDEGDVTLSGLLTQVQKLTLENTSQAKQILLLKAKIKKLFRMIKPVVTHHRLWIKSQSHMKKKSGNKGKKRSSSSKLGWKSSKDKESLDK